jgi:transposase
MLKRHALSDELWKRVEPLVPGKGGDPARTVADNRLFVEAVIFVLKTGVSWSALLERYGKPNTVWKQFDRWCRNGIWEQITKALRDPELDEVQLDSTTIKAHPIASTGRRKAGKKQGPLTTRIAWDAAAAD